MARPTITPRDEEREFAVGELFFSTTDRKGVIISGNEVFVRISAHPIEELIGAAHNIIRHPDMPKAVFKLVWDAIGAGQPVAGYVKNMAADGKYYWVMALIVPVPQGYLSVRLKPTTALWRTAASLYPDLLAIERAAVDSQAGWRSGMQAAGEKLLAALKAAGFASYEEFMHAALAAEVGARRALLGGVTPAAEICALQPSDDPAGLQSMLDSWCAIDQLLDNAFSHVDRLLQVIRTLDSKTAFLHGLSKDVHMVSLNAVIAACRLDDRGAGLSVVTQNLATVSQESTASIGTMTAQLTALTGPLRQTAFSITAAKLQVEMTILFLRELIAGTGADLADAASGQRVAADIAALNFAIHASVSELAAALPRAAAPLERLGRLQAEVSTDLRRLSTVQLIGKVQAAGVPEESHFRELLDRIFDQLRAGAHELEELTSGIAEISSRLPMFSRSARDLSTSVDALGAERAA